MFDQDRSQFLRETQMMNNPALAGQSGVYQSTAFAPGLDLSRISVGTNEEDIRIVIFPKCKPQIFSTKSRVV